MTKPRLNAIWLITVGTFFAFFVFGFTDNLKGGTIPALLQDLKFSYSQGGTILFGAYVGFILATLFTGILADVAGKKAVILVASACLIIGILGYTTTNSYLTLTASMLILGMGLGSIELGANAIIVDLYAEQKGRYLNLMAAIHGMGSMLAPLFAGMLLAAGFSWRKVYQGDLLLAGVLLLSFLLLKLPRSTQSKEAKMDFASIRKIAFTGQMKWLYLLIGLYVATEIGIASWIVEFLQKTKFQSILASTRSLSLFFAAIMIGRLFGSFFVDRAGYYRSMLVATTGSVICIALGMFGPPELGFFLPLTGVFLAIIFPTLTAVVANIQKENQGTVLGLLFTFAGVGGMLGPWLVGVLSDRLGLQMGFGVILLFGLLMTLVLLVIMGAAKMSANAEVAA